MNCLLLLVILFCCHGNGGCHTGSCGVRNNSVRDCGREQNCAGNRNIREEDSVRKNSRGECDATPYTHTPPPMSRTQFPYLDVEPRTCGCEEKEGN